MKTGGRSGAGEHTPDRHGQHKPAAAPRTSHTDIRVRFGQRLRLLRRERQMTQLQMAVRFGVDRSFISELERGRKAISLPMLETFAIGFRISVSELLQGL